MEGRKKERTEVSMGGRYTYMLHNTERKEGNERKGWVESKERIQGRTISEKGGGKERRYI